MSLQSINYPYKVAELNQNFIDRIKGLKSNDIRVNLFIGRSPSGNDLPLPMSSAKEVWISLSVDRIDENAFLDPNRIHLILDCNASDQMQKIQGLFRLVVIDLRAI